MQYIQDSLPWVCMPFAGGSRGDIFTIYKEIGKERKTELVAAIIDAANKTPITFDAAEECIIESFINQGSRFPVCFIGERDPFTSDYTTGFMVKYNGVVNLDYADPDFFDYLDQVLDHIKVNDDFSSFSLEHRNGT